MSEVLLIEIECWGDYCLCFAIQDVKSYLSGRKFFLLTKLPYHLPLPHERRKKEKGDTELWKGGGRPGVTYLFPNLET